MKLHDAKEGGGWAPGGRYPVLIESSEATLAASSGAPMLKLSGTIDGGEFSGVLFFDNIITDAAFRGAGFGKQKLRGLGIKEVDQPVEISDEVIASRLTGLRCFADLDTEPILDEDVKGSKNYVKPRTTIENGKQVPVMKNVVRAYYTQNVGAATGVVATQATQAPQGLVPSLPPGYGQPQQGFAPTQPGPAPTQNGAPTAQLPWQTAPQAQPQAQPGTGGGRGRGRAK